MGQSFLDDKIIIIADYRERSVINYLTYYDCSVKEKNLMVGDFILSDRVCVERKKFQDFVNSIFDGRLFKQASELKKNFEKPIMIIEGRKYFGNVNKNSIRGALSSMAIDYGIPLIFTDDEEDTAGMLFTIAKREQKELNKSISIRGKKNKKNIYEMQKFLVSGLPFVNNKLSETLLESFKTPEKVFTADEEKLKKIKSIGEKKAKIIRKLLQTKFKKKNTNKNSNDKVKNDE